MILLSLLSVSLIASTRLILAINPLSIGLTILIIAIILTIIFALTLSSWLALLIFLIYIRGILVLFSYFVAITPNQTLPSIYILIILSSAILPIYALLYSNILSYPIIQLYNTTLNTIYLQHNTTNLSILATILLITMIIVVKITLKFKGPLRPFSNQYVPTYT